MPDYSPEQLQDIYKELPADLQEALFSEQNAKNIHDACAHNGVDDEDIIFDVAKNVGYVLLGLLPPSELEWVLKKDLEIEEEKAKIISGELHRFVFYPVRKTLEALYGIKIIFAQKPETVVPIEPPLYPSPEGKKSRERNRSARKDVYRETIQ